MARTIDLTMLPNGQERNHWLIFDENGPITMPQGAVMTSIGPRSVGGSIRGHRKARLACQPNRTSVLPETRGDTIKICSYSDDPRAANCPECLATEEHKAAMAMYAELAAR